MPQKQPSETRFWFEKRYRRFVVQRGFDENVSQKVEFRVFLPLRGRIFIYVNCTHPPVPSPRHREAIPRAWTFSRNSLCPQAVAGFVSAFPENCIAVQLYRLHFIVFQTRFLHAFGKPRDSPPLWPLKPSVDEFGSAPLRPPAAWARAPLRLTPGATVGLYVHSALPGDRGLVYDNQRGRVTHADPYLQVCGGVCVGLRSDDL